MGESVNKDVSTTRHTPSHTIRALNIIALHMCPSVQHPVFVTRQLYTGVNTFTHGALNIIALHMCPSVQHPVFVTRQLML
ncbi:hypothetical protein J6590_066438 [Homalodisca vitripennis]|nr:hypothetical protein J6590_066438 [Homalodisca vitripennis]